MKQITRFSDFRFVCNKLGLMTRGVPINKYYSESKIKLPGWRIFCTFNALDIKKKYIIFVSYFLGHNVTSQYNTIGKIKTITI